LFTQPAFLSIVELQITKSFTATQEARRSTDMMMLGNLALLDSLLATTEQGYTWITGDQAGSKLSRQDFEKAIACSDDLIALAGHDQLAKQY
ncbi:hypothetical protein ABTC74_19410, partial [Acinetobacter baumannii]